MVLVVGSTYADHVKTKTQFCSLRMFLRHGTCDDWSLGRILHSQGSPLAANLAVRSRRLFTSAAHTCTNFYAAQSTLPRRSKSHQTRFTSGCFGYCNLIFTNANVHSLHSGSLFPILNSTLLHTLSYRLRSHQIKHNGNSFWSAVFNGCAWASSG